MSPKPGTTQRIDDEYAAEDQTTLNESVARGSLFYCPNAPRCSAKYLRYNKFLEHLAGDRCSTRVKKRQSSMVSYILKTYVEKFSSSPYEQNLTQNDRRHLKIHLEHLEPIVFEKTTYPRAPYDLGYPSHINYKLQGWALPTRKVATVYDMDQVNYSKSLFLQGQRTNQKITPEEAEIQIRDAINPRTKELYPPNQWLTCDQFKYAFQLFHCQNPKRIDFIYFQISFCQVYSYVETRQKS